MEKRLQSYENVRNSLIQLFLNSQAYQTYDSSVVSSQPAYGLMTSSNQSMWFASGSNATVTGGFTADQLAAYSSYQNFEAYNQAILPDMAECVNSTAWTFLNGLLFTFPSSPNNLSATSNIYSAEHNATVQNYQRYQQNYTVVPNSSGRVCICSVVVNASQLLGTLCFNYNGSNFFTEGFQQSIIPQTVYLSQVFMSTMSTPDQ
jgi:hypothetical protein